MTVQLVRPMVGRDPDEVHRAATPLELFFDLTFVVAVAQAGATMHHLLVEGGHAGDAELAFPMVFFAIWWAWMNFTWFASAYDSDDAVYRVTVFVQMAGVLVFATGVPRFLEDLDGNVVVAGYLIMRLGLVAQWLRAAIQHPEGRACALRYAVGVSICQVGWLLLVLAPDDWWAWGFVPLAVAELAVPAWAEHGRPSSWHPGHIAERYGLFTIIVLGESVLAAAAAVEAALDAGAPFGDLVTTAVGGFLVVVAMWWLYFDLPVDRLLTRARAAFSDRRQRESFIWGYGHYLVFASAAAVGVGLAVAVDQITHHSELTDLEAALTVTVPVALYLLTVWLLHWRHKEPGWFRAVSCPVTVVAVLATSWTAEPVLLTGLALAALILASLLVLRPAPTD